MAERILVLGSSGQIGTDLIAQLRKKHGSANVVASDLREPQDSSYDGPFEVLDATDKEGMLRLINKYEITQIYHLVAMLSATAEKFPAKGWDLNMLSLFNALELAKEGHYKQLYWPSSIAAFGPTTPKQNTEQYTIMDPTTVYGISKLSGELWCQYYHNNYGVDVRGLRYPGLISYKAAPGGGTTDYAVEIFHEALKNKKYTSYIGANTRLPMMYMPDAIKATIGIMEATPEDVKIRTSYNLAAFSFTPAELAIEIQKHIPDFEISYKEDFRDKIAQGWPQSIEDSYAQKDWGWKLDYKLEDMVSDMLQKLAAKYQ